VVYVLKVWLKEGREREGKKTTGKRKEKTGPEGERKMERKKVKKTMNKLMKKQK